MGWLFVIGSACFAIGVPMSLNDVRPPTHAALVFFAGSLFFTSASTVQMVMAWRAGDASHSWSKGQALRSGNPAWTSSWIQWFGTLEFNVTTLWGVVSASGQEAVSNQVIWRPDAIGSVLFLVSSAIALHPEVRRHRHGHARDRSWTICSLNMIGSVFFGLSAVGAYIAPGSNELLNSAWSNGGTFLGALCFLIGAWLVIPNRQQERYT
jgi:hypothetical protein